MTEIQKQIVIDAANATLGRLSSYAAKQLLLGKKLEIVNCNKAIILGNSDSIKAHYQKLRKRGGSSLKGPFFPKSPEKIVKRTIRGMLPDYRTGRGVKALNNLRCYNETPPELEKIKKIISGKNKLGRKIILAELSKVI